MRQLANALLTIAGLSLALWLPPAWALTNFDGSYEESGPINWTLFFAFIAVCAVALLWQQRREHKKEKENLEKQIRYHQRDL